MRVALEVVKVVVMEVEGRGDREGMREASWRRGTTVMPGWLWLCVRATRKAMVR